jgi:hypothetical protein
MSPPNTAASTQDNRTNSAFRVLGERLEGVTNSQQIMLGRLDGLAVTLTSLCTDTKALQMMVQGHEQRISKGETRWDEQIKPALGQLDELRMQVAKSALFGAAGGGGIVIIVAAALKAFGVI